jgi:RNA polymerase sigma-70 factor (ECF subfamily)
MVHAMVKPLGIRSEIGDMVPVDFQRVLTEFGPSLARLTLGYEVNPESRKDLLQEIYIAVWRSLAIYDDRCSLRTWVYRVAHNTAVKHVMRVRRRAFATFKNLEDIDEPADPKNLEEDLSREMALRELSLFIARLKPLDRQIILLYIEDIGAEEIAEITGMSRGAVGVKVHRIKQLLIKMFGPGARNVQRR